MAAEVYETVEAILCSGCRKKGKTPLRVTRATIIDCLCRHVNSFDKEMVLSSQPDERFGFVLTGKRVRLHCRKRHLYTHTHTYSCRHVLYIQWCTKNQMFINRSKHHDCQKLLTKIYKQLFAIEVPNREFVN